jgi:hypothetical protein
MLYSSDQVPDTVPYDNQTMFDLAAKDSLGWYWPGRHDYYLYNSPPRVQGTACETYCNPLKRNPNFMKPMSSFAIPNSPLPGQGLHPHIYHESDNWEGTPELEIYADEFIPNLSSINIMARKRHTVPNGGNTPGAGPPRHVLISPNVAVSCGHFGVAPHSPANCAGRTGGLCKQLDYRVEDPETGAVFVQRGFIREHYGMGSYAENVGNPGWESLGFGGQATLSFIEWTDVHGPINPGEFGGNCRDENGNSTVCNELSTSAVTEDPLGEGGTCTLTIGTCNYCPSPCLGGNYIDILDIPNTECNTLYHNGSSHVWTANVLGGETQTRCDDNVLGDYFTSYGHPNHFLCDGRPCEFQLDNINITRVFGSGTTEPTEITFNIQDEFKFPQFLPRFSYGRDPLIAAVQEYPGFVLDQDARVVVAPVKVVENSLGKNYTDQIVSLDKTSTGWNEGTELILSDSANNLLDLGRGATFDFKTGIYSGDSSSPYFMQLGDTNNRPIYMGFVSGGENFANQLHETYEFLSGHTSTLLADGTERSYHEDVYGPGGIYSRILTREYFGLPECDFDQYPPCGYELDINEEYADAFIDVHDYINLGIKQSISINNIDENTTLIYSSPKTDVSGDSVIHKISHEDPSQPARITNVFTRPHLTDVIDNVEVLVRKYGIKPATPQKIGNYVFVASAAANVLERGDHGRILYTDSGKVIILNHDDLLEPQDELLFKVPKGITGQEINDEFFGSELASNNKELFVSASAHLGEASTGVTPQVYVYEPNENESGALRVVALRQTITQDSHTVTDRFGYSIDATDDWLVIGAPGASREGTLIPANIPGKVYIYKKNLETNQWDLNTTIDSTNQINNEILNENNDFGFSVSINDNYVAIGCPQDKELVDGINEYNFGSVFIYSLGDGDDAWSFNQKVTFSNVGLEDFATFDLLDIFDQMRFGHRVDLTNNSLLVSAPGLDSDQIGLEEEAGVAMLFSIDGDKYVLKDLFDGLSFGGEGLGEFISLYEKTNVNNQTQTTKRVIALSKIKRAIDPDQATVYILKTSDESNVNTNPGNEGDQDGDYEGYRAAPDDRVLSGRAIIQDSKLWQDYSYLIDVASPGSTGTTGGGPSVILVEEYEKPMLEFMHPLGLQFFGGARLDDVVGGVIPEDVYQSLETGVIGHYTSYTFNTIQNLRYNENLADLYPEGYNPQATGAGSNGNVFALPPENSPGGTTHTNRGFPYGRSGASFAQGDGYTAADIRGYPYWMIFNHPNIWLEGVSGPSGSPEQSSYATAGAASFGMLPIEDVVRMNIDIDKVRANAPGALLQSPNIGNPAGQTGNTLLHGLLDGPSGGVQY